MKPNKMPSGPARGQQAGAQLGGTSHSFGGRNMRSCRAITTAFGTMFIARHACRGHNAQLPTRRISMAFGRRLRRHRRYHHGVHATCQFSRRTEPGLPWLAVNQVAAMDGAPRISVCRCHPSSPNIGGSWPSVNARHGARKTDTWQIGAFAD